MKHDPPVAATPLALRLLHSFEDSQPIRQAWDAAVLRAGADIYQSYEWCRTWWRYYGEQRELHLLLFYQGDILIGIVPAFIEKLRLGPVGLRVAKSVGSDHTIQLCNLPVPLRHLAEVTILTLGHFIGTEHCDLVVFGPLSGQTGQPDTLIQARPLTQEPAWKVETASRYCNTYFSLPGSFNAYLSSLGGHYRENFRRTFSKLSTSHQVVCDVVSAPAECLAEYDTFRRLHNLQWQTDGKLGHFTDWPEAEDFNRTLVRTLGERGQARFHRILVDGRVVSSQYGFVFGDTYYWRLPARVLGKEWDKLGLGKMAVVKMIESLISEGRHTIEAGRGSYAYKAELGGRETPLLTVQFMHHGFGVLLRVRLFRLLARGLNLLYYRLIFARLAPRIAFLRGPLWKVWIRLTW